MKNYSRKTLAILSGSVLGLLPISTAFAETCPKPCPKSSSSQTGFWEEFERRFGDLPNFRDLSGLRDGARGETKAESKTHLGVRLQPLTPELAQAFGIKDESGALIAEVMPQSPAERAGLKQGDVITAVNDQEIADAAALQKHIAAQTGGAKVEIQYLRGGDTKTAQAELAGPAADKKRSAQAADEKRGDAAAPADKTLGMSVADLNERLRAQHKLPEKVEGALVAAIAEDSAADRAGLRVGDVIQEIDQQEVKDAAAAAALSKETQEKDKVLVRVWSRGAARFAVLDRNA